MALEQGGVAHVLTLGWSTFPQNMGTMHGVARGELHEHPIGQG